MKSLGFPVFHSAVWMITSLFYFSPLPMMAIETPSAATLTAQGKQAYEQGSFGLALEKWEQATQRYQQDKDITGVTGSLVNQSQAFTALGMHRRACKTIVIALQLDSNLSQQLCEVDFSTTPIPKSSLSNEVLRVLGLRQLGDSLRLIGNLERSQQVLRQAQQESSEHNPEIQASILLSLGNVAKDLGNRERDRNNELGTSKVALISTGESCGTLAINSSTVALSYYQSAIECYKKVAQLTSPPNQPNLKKLQAQLNHLGLVLEVSQWLKKNEQSSESEEWLNHSNSSSLIQTLKTDIQALPFSYEVGYARISFARHFDQWQRLSKNSVDTQLSEFLLRETIQRSSENNLSNSSSLISLALGELGWLYEKKRDWNQALDYTYQALQTSSQASADIRYQWKWQQGRLLKSQSKRIEAIAAYEDAVKLLESARQDVQSVNPDAQFALRDSVEPVYRELIDLQLQGENPDYESIIKKVDALQLAELENFLRCKIRLNTPTSVSKISKDESAAVFYPIILDDRLEVIVSLPNGDFHRHSTPIRRIDLAQKLKQGYENLVQIQDGEDYRRIVEPLYNQIIRPVKSKLKESQVQILVFVLDGDLRKIPMAALRDQQTNEFLIDQYPVAITPGVNVLGAKFYPRHQLKALVGGLTTSPTAPVVVKGNTFHFENLPGIPNEVQLILKSLPNSKPLIGNAFTPRRMQQEIDNTPYPIIHLATHGNFSSDPQATFFLTDGGNVMTVNDLQSTLQQQNGKNILDLIVFSACQTASGDRRSTLGMAGAAIRSGASSTLASLWSVEDNATAELMGHFYEALVQNPQATKAEALQQATQKTRQKHSHPAYWSPFILVGNWR